MNYHKLTQRSRECYLLWSKLQILLLVSFISYFAVPARAQVMSGVREQSESVSPNGDPQAQTQRKTPPALHYDRFHFKEHQESTSRRLIVAAGVNFTLNDPGTGLDHKHPQGRYSTNESSDAATSQPTSPSSKFAVFVDAGATVPHGDFSTSSTRASVSTPGWNT